MFSRYSADIMQKIRPKEEKSSFPTRSKSVNLTLCDLVILIVCVTFLVLAILLLSTLYLKRSYLFGQDIVQAFISMSLENSTQNETLTELL